MRRDPAVANGIAALDFVERSREWRLSLDALLALHHYHRAGALTDEEIGCAADCFEARLDLYCKADGIDVMLHAHYREAA